MSVDLNSVVNLSVSEMISMVTQSRGRELLPLSHTKRIYIDHEALMLKHDRRVEAAFERWKRENLH